jgi:8-oxo-dGTP diphosphatase
MKIGCARASTEDQDTAVQVAALKAAGCERIFPSGESPLMAGTDAAAAGWFPVDALPELAFDHGRIIDYAVNRLRNKLEYTSVGFEPLPKKFTLTKLQMLHEAILGRSLDKRNFCRKILATGLLTASKEMEITGRKPARLYAYRNPK